MTQDKQLRGVSLDAVLEKRRLGQALNAKEFAVLAGVSYSAAREWFRTAGFPVFRGVVFWTDFVQWRTARHAIGAVGCEVEVGRDRKQPERSMEAVFGGKAGRILAQVG